MRYGLTIVYTTSRREPKIEWFFDSLAKQIYSHEEEAIKVIVVDSFADPGRHEWMAQRLTESSATFSIKHVAPKPTIWQGPHRITREDWWAKSNALNTGIALCKTEWIAFCDDRCILGPHWLQSIRHAMDDEYAVCGSYEKRSDMKVEDGAITDYGTLIGEDVRQPKGFPVPTKDWYGGSGALPLEWCLAVNGFSEDLCDSLGLEDAMFGVTLHNSGYPICYDSRMMLLEDRTQGQIDGALKRTDKGISPNDKSHEIVARLHHSTTSMNSYDIRDVRNRVLASEPFPPPSASHTDWFDGQPVSEFA